MEVLFDHENGTFSSENIYLIVNNSFPRKVLINDVNNDGNLDIIVIAISPPNLSIFLGYGNATLLIIVTTLHGNDLRTFIGFGNGTFENMAIYSTGSVSRLSGCRILDWNNDDDQDVVVSNYLLDNIVLFKGYGNGTFSLERTYSTGSA